MPSSVVGMIGHWTAQDVRCRQGPDDDADTIAACDRKDLLEPQIAALGYCRIGSTPARWRLCN